MLKIHKTKRMFSRFVDYLAALSIRHQDASTSAAFRASIALRAASLTAIFSFKTFEKWVFVSPSVSSRVELMPSTS